MTAPTIVDWHLKFGFGHARRTDDIQQIFVHTTENWPSTKATDVAEFQLSTQSGSYHWIIDRNIALRCNTADWFTWSVGNYGNNVGLHIAFVGYAADAARDTRMTRADWLAEEANHGTLSRGAWVMAKWCREHDIPARFSDSMAVLDGRKGIATHDVARQAWGVTTHWDPGPDFPMDVLIDLTAGYLTPTPPKEINPVTNFDTTIQATDGSSHKVVDLVRYTDGRVYDMYTVILPRIEETLTRLETKIDRLTGEA